MIKPKKLTKGDTVAIVSLSSGAAQAFPHIYENGIKVLEELGLNIKEYPTTRKSSEYLHAHPKQRAEDLNAAIKDKQVKAIISSIGGEDSIRILPYIDYEAIKEHPKLIMGYSDATAYLIAINNTGVVTFHGPAVMAGFSQAHALEETFLEHVKTMLFEGPQNYTYPVYEQYSEGSPHWSDKNSTGKVNPLKDNPGARHLQGQTVEGVLWGGCRELLSMLNGTAYWPQPEFFKNKILFIETSEEQPPIAETKWLLRSLAAQGILANINALLFGRSAGYTDEMKQELDEMLIDISKEAGREDLTIVTGLDFGHTDPQIILPLGCKARIETDCTLQLLERSYRDKPEDKI